MAAIAEDRQFKDRLRRIETLLQDVEKFKDPEARAKTREIVQTLMDFHGAGLERILAHLATTSEVGPARIEQLAQDELVASLLLLYGMHPVDLDSRVRQALEKVRPYLHSHGGNVELLEIDDGVVRLRLQGSCHGCPSSALTLKQTIEEAIMEKAPDVVGIEVEADAPAPLAVGVMEEVSHGGNGNGRFALPILGR
jgi:Fe-S cluster biogenesis protein NfuA